MLVTADEAAGSSNEAHSLVFMEAVIVEERIALRLKTWVSTEESTSLQITKLVSAGSGYFAWINVSHQHPHVSGSIRMV